MKKVTLFSGYIIINNALYHDKEALSKIEELLQNTDILEVCSQLNGSFRFVIDTPTNTFFGIDHFGGYSLFYKNFPNFEIIINPNQKSQLSDIQDNQLCSLLASGFCYGDNTLFKNIKECTPGILYSYDKINKTLIKQEWFRIDFSQQKVRKKEELSHLLLSLIPDNFQQSHLALTGGIDSRLLLSLFRKKAAQITAITYGTTNNPDINLAEHIAQHSEIEHLSYYFDKLDLKPYFENEELMKFFSAGFLGRSLPFESDWVVSNILKNSTSWITTGFTSFWLRSPYQDHLPVPDKASLIAKIINTHSQQTLHSSAKFKSIIQENIIESMTHFQMDNFDSDYDRWNVENRQHKYIINSCNNYRQSNIEVFLPLFDKRLMSFLNNTSREQRLEQKIYMDAIISDIFIGNESYLRNIPTTNPKFSNHIKQNKTTAFNWKKQILQLDRNNFNRIFRKPSNPMYGIIQSVLLQSPDFLSLKVQDAFPNIKNTISLLNDLNLTNSAKHLTWLQNKRVVQLNLLGIEIMGFLVDKFDLLLKN